MPVRRAKECKVQNADPSTAYTVPLPFQGRQAKCKIASDNLSVKRQQKNKEKILRINVILCSDVIPNSEFRIPNLPEAL